MATVGGRNFASSNETEQHEDVTCNCLVCRLGSPPLPHISMLTGKIFSLQNAPFDAATSTLNKGGRGETEMLAAFKPWEREASELAIFRPPTVSGECRCALKKDGAEEDRTDEHDDKHDEDDEE